MTVPVQTPYNAYDANGVTLSFAYQFLIRDVNDIAITLNDVPVTTGYTVTNVGQNNGGDILFLTAPSGRLIIRRAVIAQRLTDYQENGPLLSATVNSDFDRVIMMIQDKQADQDTALKHPLGETDYDAKGAKIVNLGAPENGGDAASREWVEVAFTDIAENAVSQAEAARDVAVAARNAASASATSAVGSANAAAGSATTASLKAAEAGSYADSAFSSASAAAGSASTASGAANSATSQATAAAGSASTAVAARDEAQKWATNPKDQAVNGTQFSAYHWAQYSLTYSNNAASAANTATSQATQASNSAAAAALSAASAAADAAAAATANPDNQLKKANNLSDVTSVSTSRNNLSVYSKSESDTRYDLRSAVLTWNEAVAQGYMTVSPSLDTTVMDSNILEIYQDEYVVKGVIRRPAGVDMGLPVTGYYSIIKWPTGVTGVLRPNTLCVFTSPKAGGTLYNGGTNVSGYSNTLTQAVTPTTSITHSHTAYWPGAGLTGIALIMDDTYIFRR